MKKFFLIFVIIIAPLFLLGCKPQQQDSTLERASNTAATTTVTESQDDSSSTTDSAAVSSEGVKIIFLHHSTGSNIWAGGVEAWFDEYNNESGIHYTVTEQDFPKDSPYGWNNYPYDYWNIWVNYAGESTYMEEPTLELLTEQYDMIIWKHCYPVSQVEADSGSPDITSEVKSIENYQLQYNALKKKMREFPDTDFIVWTGAAQVQGETDAASARRAQTFFHWVRDEWDEEGDNIYIWDFFQLQTSGGIYFRAEYAESKDDSHPNASFSYKAAPLFGQRVVNVAEGKGDASSLTGE